MRSARDWDDVVLTGAPRLVVGWRPRARRLDAARVEVHGDAEKHLRDIGAATLSRLAQLTAVPYGDAVLPEPGEEYMSISLQAYAAGPHAGEEALHTARMAGRRTFRTLRRSLTYFALSEILTPSTRFRPNGSARAASSSTPCAFLSRTTR